MEAIRFTSKNKNLQLVQVPLPTVISKNILIKVAYSGICGTDIHIIQGEFPCNENDTFTLGHEFSGTVIDVASDVKEFKIGDHVVVDPNSGCHCCHYCRSGNPHFCQRGGIKNTVGIYRDGGWAQYVVVPEEQVHKLPDSITLQQAALTEPLSCLAHGWDLIQPIHIGQNILITGAGIIGNLWVCALHLQGHKRVTVSEPNPARLEMIKKLNTGYTLLTPDQLKKQVDSDPNYRFDLIIDCSGFPPAIESGLSYLTFGGKLCVFGVAPPHGKITISPFEIYMKEAKIIGVNINPFTFPKSIGLVEAMGERYLNFENLGIKTFALKDYKIAMEYLKQGSISKAIFKLS